MIMTMTQMMKKIILINDCENNNNNEMTGLLFHFRSKPGIVWLDRAQTNASSNSCALLQYNGRSFVILTYLYLLVRACILCNLY